MAYKKKKRSNIKRTRYSTEEKRSFWVGYGIGLSEKKSLSPACENEGERFLSSGPLSSVASANKGYDLAKKDRKENLHKRFTRKK